MYYSLFTSSHAQEKGAQTPLLPAICSAQARVRVLALAPFGRLHDPVDVPGLSPIHRECLLPMEGLFSELIDLIADKHPPAIQRGDEAIEASNPVLKLANQRLKIGGLTIIKPDQRPFSRL